MKKLNFEQRALSFGVAINFYSAFIGGLFFFLTRSSALFLDTMISAILCVSTIISMLVSKAVNKKESRKYPLGRDALENIFLLFRAGLMFALILYTIIDSSSSIYAFVNKTLVEDLNLSTLYLIIYMALMASSCFLITIVYIYYNKRLEVKSSIISLEIKASIYDGLVTIVAVSTLLLFSNIPFLKAYQAIGDAVTSIILSLLYLSTPIREIIRQINFLSDKRNNFEVEKNVKKQLVNKYKQFDFYDVYCSLSDDICSIYVCLLPKNDEMSADEVSSSFENISNYLYQEYNDCKVFLILTDKQLQDI